MKGQASMFPYLNKSTQLTQPSQNTKPHIEEEEVITSSKGRLRKKHPQMEEEQEFVVPLQKSDRDRSKEKESGSEEDISNQRYGEGDAEDEIRRQKEKEEQKAKQKSQKKSNSKSKSNSNSKSKSKKKEEKGPSMTEKEKKELQQQAKLQKEARKKVSSLDLLDQIDEIELNSDDEQLLKLKAIEFSQEKTQINQDYELALKLSRQDEGASRPQSKPMEIEDYSFKGRKADKHQSSQSQTLALKSPGRLRIIEEPKTPVLPDRDKHQQPKSKAKHLSPSGKKSSKRTSKSRSPSAVGDKQFSGKTIVLSGLFTLDRDRLQTLLESLGAKVTNSVSGKTSFLLQGYASPDGRPIELTNKTEKARSLKIPIIKHQDLEAFFVQWTNKSASEHFGATKKPTAPKPVPKRQEPKETENKQFHLWCHKYAPQSLDDIIGQAGPVNHARTWLQKWEDVHRKGIKHQTKKPFSYFYPVGDLNSKAMLFSGSPGLGKTTLARLIGQEYGYKVVQYNASDVRNKASISIIQTGSWSLNFNKKESKEKILIILDEVDGLSGGDRGGTMAMIQLIKNSLVPIICICNERQHPKIKSLGGHCYNVVFTQPSKEDILKRLVHILNQEHVTFDRIALTNLIDTFNMDIRQILNYLNLYCTNHTKLSNQDTASSQDFKKDDNVQMDMWSASNKLLNRSQFQKMNLRERLDMFFVDYEFVPLIVQNCLIGSLPKRVLKPFQFERFVKATEVIAKGDVINRCIRRYQEWKLMPLYGILSSVIPTEMCSDAGKASFPIWLGNNSKARKIGREIKELQAAFRLSTSGGRKSTKDYAQTLYYIIHHNLVKHSKEKENDKSKKIGRDDSCCLNTAVELMYSYRITPDMFKEHMKDIQLKEEEMMDDVPAPIKASLTKVFNQRYNASRTTFASSKASAGDPSSKYDPLLEEIVIQDDNGDEDSEDSRPQVINPKNKSKPANKKRVQSSSQDDQ